MPFSETDAVELIGKSRDDYQCNHVVNKALNGNKALGGTASSYLTWGSIGIFISPTEFIHSSSSKNRVIRAPLSQLPHVLRRGYVLRKQ